MPAAAPAFPARHRLQLLASYLRRSEVCPGLPLTGIIATTHRCNQSCRMCIRAVRAFDGPNMSFGLFEKIIEEWIPYLRYISLDGPGETTMNPDAFRMIRYARSRGVRVMFSTNATTLDSSMYDEILSSGVDLIIFSVNGTTPDVYEAIHGRPSYETVTANIRRFLARKIQRGVRVLVILQMVLLPETQRQVPAFYRLWRGTRGVDLVRIKKDVVCSSAESSRDSSHDGARRNPCSRLWHGPLFIETNGDVYASPGILYRTGPVGNVTEQSLAGIWNNEAMRSMRRLHAAGKAYQLEECARCAYPRPLLPLILAGFLLDPFTVGKFVPLAERLAFWHRLPLYERIPWISSDAR